MGFVDIFLAKLNVISKMLRESVHFLIGFIWCVYYMVCIVIGRTLTYRGAKPLELLFYSTQPPKSFNTHIFKTSKFD